MVVEFYEFFQSEINAIKEGGGNNIIKDDEFENLRIQKGATIWGSYLSLFIFYKFGLTGKAKGRFKNRVFEKAYEARDVYHKIVDKLPPPTIFNKNVFFINKQNYSHIENFKNFISHRYNPPDDIDIILSQLGTLYLFYEFLSSHDVIPINLVFRIDLVMTRLITMATAMSVIIIAKGGDIDRTKLSAKTRKELAGKRTMEIFSIYEEKRKNSRFWEDLSDSQKAKIIAKAFKKKGEKSPGESTIRRDIRIGRELGLI